MTILMIIYFHISQPIDSYEFKDDKFSYSENRGKPEYQISLINATEKINIYALNFQTRNFLDSLTRIYALLFIPQQESNLPGVVFLPGGGMRKEQREKVATTLSEKGYAILVIDQRGIGQTGGEYLSFEDDYQIFLRGKEPIQHLSVYDVLKSLDVLRAMDNVNKNNIVVIGESMGGRYAIIAAALEKRIKGAVVISSAGFGFENNENVFLRSIDPDNYVEKIFQEI